MAAINNTPPVKEFDILEVQDVIPKDGCRRLVTVFVEVRQGVRTDTLKLGYPAYGDEHMISTIDYYNKLEGTLNYTLSGAISRELRNMATCTKGLKS